MSVPPSELLEALSAALSYPWNGLAETVEPLRALSGSDAYAERIACVLRRSEQFDDRTHVQLAYTRLFIGSFKMEAPPYASYYLEKDHILNGRAAAEVKAVYAQFGIELDSDQIAPADHLRYLLAFLALMAKRFEETGDSAFAEAYADFRDEYVLSWIDQCKSLVDTYAEEPYYPELFAFIVDVLRSKGE